MEHRSWFRVAETATSYANFVEAEDRGELCLMTLTEAFKVAQTLLIPRVMRSI